MTSKNQWVSPRKNGNGWAVHGAGNSKDTKHFDNKAEAIMLARLIAENQKSEMIVQNKNGKIGIKNSYGNDPFPPRDKN